MRYLRFSLSWRAAHCRMRSEPTSVVAVVNPGRTLPASVSEFESHASPATAVSQAAYEAPAVAPPEPQVARDGPAPIPERILPGRIPPALAAQEASEPFAESPQSAYGSDDPSDPFNGQAELSVEQLMAEVQARNPSLQAASAAWRAAAERYPQVVSFDDPMFTGMISPKGIGMDDGGGWMVARLAKGSVGRQAGVARQRGSGRSRGHARRHWRYPVAVGRSRENGILFHARGDAAPSRHRCQCTRAICPPIGRGARGSRLTSATLCRVPGPRRPNALRSPICL